MFVHTVGGILSLLQDFLSNFRKKEILGEQVGVPARKLVTPVAKPQCLELFFRVKTRQVFVQFGHVVDDYHILGPNARARCLSRAMPKGTP